ncbi:MAG TPA: hypothetical protein VGM53_29305 [Streptosporangiaceae bacterium]
MDTRQQDASPARSGSGRRRRASRRARAAGLAARARRRAGFAPPLTALTTSRAPSHAISAAS